MRAIGAAAFAAGALVGWLNGVASSPWVMLAALVVSADATIRRTTAVFL